MKRCLPLILATIGAPAMLLAQATHLDIMVPDREDTDLVGPVKSIELDVCINVSGEHTRERREYDRIGNLLQSSEWDSQGKPAETTRYFYDESGCLERRIYESFGGGFTNEWTVVLNPETRQIAMKNNRNGSVSVRTYSPEKYLLHYRMIDQDRKLIRASRNKRDKDNRRTEYTRFDEDNRAEYTYFFKWKENGFIDRERQRYGQDKKERFHTYEYLLVDDRGNWTQQLMVRYDISGKEKVKVYEQITMREIEYFEDESIETELNEPEDRLAENKADTILEADVEIPEPEFTHAVPEAAVDPFEIVSTDQENPKELTEEDQKEEHPDELKSRFDYSFDDLSYHLVTLKCESGGGEYSGCGFIAYMDEKPYLLTSQRTLLGAEKIQFLSNAYRIIKPHGIELSNERDMARMALSPSEALTLSSTASMSDAIAVFGSTPQQLEISQLGTITGVGADIIEVSADFTEDLGGSPVLNTSGDVVGMASYVRESTYHAMKKGTKFENKTRRFCYRIDGIEWKPVRWKSFNRKYGMTYRQSTAFVDAIIEILNSWADDPFDRIHFKDAPGRTLTNWADSHNKVVGYGENKDSFQRKYYANYSESTRKLAEVCRGKASQLRMLAEQRGLTEFLYNEFDMQAGTLEDAADIIDRYTTTTDY